MLYTGEKEGEGHLQVAASTTSAAKFSGKDKSSYASADRVPSSSKPEENDPLEGLDNTAKLCFMVILFY